MVRRIVVVLANILLLCAAVARGASYYGHVETSAPQWVPALVMGCYYLPAIVFVNIANGVWKRIQQHRSCREFLVISCNVILILVAIFTVDGAFHKNAWPLVACCAAIAVLNVVNLWWKSWEEKKESAPEAEE